MSGIDKERWEVLSSQLDELLELDEPARSERLEQMRRADSALADDLSGFLTHQRTVRRAGFLEGSALLVSNEPTLVGQVVGSYTLDRLLGQGGMGTVWLAHRSDGHYEAHVAIKLLNLALIGSMGVDRFRREGNILARLTHPNIARLLDAGITLAGQPYLVLEYVEGEPIDQWCSTHAPDVVGCIRLFLEVLAAVIHAHSHLILHRDLKPSNILVTPDGRVKLLDFGLAKLLDDEQQSAPITELSQLAGRAFTPEYAAPEQVQGGEVTMATDVYSLGVLLCVLLSGRHPTASEGQTPIDRLRAVVDTDPSRPSELMARSGTLPTLQQRMSAVRGDLDNIVVKALKKTPVERYGTVAALAEDLRRYLNHEPVSARADSVSYRVARLVARNKLAVSTAAVVLISVVAAAVVSLWQAREATRQRDRVLALSARNEAVVDFVSRMLMEAVPANQPIRLADLLDRSQSILISEKSNPEHQAAILSLLSDYYRASGNPTKAQTLLSRSLELTRASPDKGLRATLLCNSALAELWLGRMSHAAAAIEAGLELSKSDSTAAVHCLRTRAQLAVNSNDAKGALEFSLQAQARLRDGVVAKPDDEATLLSGIAAAHYLGGRTVEANRFYAAALAKLAESGRGESHLAFTIYNNWAVANISAGDVRVALQYYDEALRIAVQRSIDGELPASLLSNRAVALSTLGRYPEALAAFDAAIASATRTGYERGRAGSIVNRASTYVALGDLDRAEQDLTGLTAQVGKTMPSDSVPAIMMKLVQARIAAARGRSTEAVAGFSDVIDFCDHRQLTIVPLTRALVSRAELNLRLGKADTAIADAQRALQVSHVLQGDNPHSAHTGGALIMLARAHESRNEHSRARIVAAEGVRHLSATLGENHPETQEARQMALNLPATTRFVPPER